MRIDAGTDEPTTVLTRSASKAWPGIGAHLHGLLIDAEMGVGGGMLEAVDLVFSASIFGWANRLMHMLGQPERS